MSDQIWTKITFPSFALRIPAVTAAIDEESPEEHNTHTGDQDAPEGSITAIAGNTHDGFDTLGGVLQRHRIPYDMWTEADFERAELTVYYRTGKTKKQDYFYNQFFSNGRAILTVDEITALLKKAKSGAAVRKALKNLLDDHTIPPLKEFVTPPERLMNFLTAPDPATLKEFDVSLSANAVVDGSIRVTATSPDEAQRAALGKTGDVNWKYCGLAGEEKPEVVGCRAIG